MNELPLGAIGTAILSLLTAVGGAFGVYYRMKKENRADAVESGDARAGLRMLETAQKERDQAEAELAAERKERLSAERALTTTVADQRDTQRNLASAIRDIAMLQRKLDRAGVPRSDWAPLMETELGDIDTGKQ